MKCKYCGAEPVSAGGGVMNFDCGTYYVAEYDTWCQDVRCLKIVRQRDADELARYRAMFPIPPWSTDPITPEVCERLGMNLLQITGTMLDPDYRRLTAGQLACLVAARKTTNDDQPGD